MEADLSRLIENLIRTGTVSQVDHARAMCRVKSGALETDWLPFTAHRAGNTRTWSPPTAGEQVLIMSPSGEPGAGIVITGIYATAHPAPSDSPDEHVTEYPDGARISYNHVSGHLAVTSIKTGVIQAATSITLDTPLTHCTGELTVDGLLTYGNGLAGTGGGNGNAISGDFTHADGSLSSNGIVLHTHTHPGTGGPQ